MLNNNNYFNYNLDLLLNFTEILQKWKRSHLHKEKMKYYKIYIHLTFWIVSLKFVYLTGIVFCVS